jgi:LacI family transcriptional regulator
MTVRVSLDDVARIAGVSRSAASRALNDRPGVKPSVRARVASVADELGFRPNRAARNLASGLSSVIGLVIPTDNLRVDPYGAALTHAVGRAAAHRDLGLMLHLANEEPGKAVHHILADGMIDGLLISSVAIGPAWVDELFDAALPTVLIGSHPTRTDLLHVAVENVESSATAVTHLFEHGCARVGCITGPLERADARERLDGYGLAHARAGRPVDPKLIVAGDFNRASGQPATATLLDRNVDGIFACNDEMAVAAIWTASHRGVRVPQDVKVVGFDGLAIDELIEPSVTTQAQPFDVLGTVAVDLLVDLVNGVADLEPVVVEPTLTIGGSTVG